MSIGSGMCNSVGYRTIPFVHMDEWRRVMGGARQDADQCVRGGALRPWECLSKIFIFHTLSELADHHRSSWLSSADFKKKLLLHARM
jgi:hypothetical protein